MKSILVLLMVAACATARAQIVSKDSLHFRADGTKVRGSFILVNRVVPLPEGEFTLITADFRNAGIARGNITQEPHRLVTVILGQMDGGRLRAALIATTVLTYHGRTGWIVEPCKEDRVVLYRLNRVPFMKRNYEQNCLIVNRFALGMGQNAAGAFLVLRDWTKEQGGQVPIEMRLDAFVTRISQAEYIAVHYMFNPAAYGCDAANLQNDAFTKAVIELGKGLQIAVNAGFSGRTRVERAEKLAAGLPRLQPDCGATLQRAPEKPDEEEEKD